MFEGTSFLSYIPFQGYKTLHSVTVCINFIKTVGFEEIHEKKNGSAEKRERMGYYPFLVVCRDKEFWLSVVIEKSLS